MARTITCRVQRQRKERKRAVITGVAFGWIFVQRSIVIWSFSSSILSVLFILDGYDELAIKCGGVLPTENMPIMKQNIGIDDVDKMKMMEKFFFKFLQNIDANKMEDQM